MKIAIYPGSFDPLTLGHVDIISRLSPYFDKFYVSVAQNADKKNLFSIEERLEMTKDILKKFPTVIVEQATGLTVDYAKKKGAKFLVRGLRSESDFQNEWVVANMNRDMAAEIETLLIFARPELSHISSRAVKEVALNAGDLTRWVPERVAQELVKKFKSNRS